MLDVEFCESKTPQQVFEDFQKTTVLYTGDPNILSYESGAGTRKLDKIV